jgi:uncharacterized protein (DUF2267 family)
LPLLVRGAYYEQLQPMSQPQTCRTVEEFLDALMLGLRGAEEIIDPEEAARAVFGVLNHYVDPGQVANVREAMPAEIRTLWPEGLSAVALGSVA